MSSAATKTDQHPPLESTITALEALGYKSATVRQWSWERAETTLATRRREDAVTVNRAKVKAAAEDAEVPVRGQPSPLERVNAASYLEQCHNVDDLNQALMYSACYLNDDETKRMAGYLIRLFRGEAARASG